MEDADLGTVLDELVAREPLFHRTERGTSRAAFEAMTADDFWEVGASGARYDREFVWTVLQRRNAAGVPHVWETSEFPCPPPGGNTFPPAHPPPPPRRRTRRLGDQRLRLPAPGRQHLPADLPAAPGRPPDPALDHLAADAPGLARPLPPGHGGVRRGAPGWLGPGRTMPRPAHRSAAPGRSAHDSGDGAGQAPGGLRRLREEQARLGELQLQDDRPAVRVLDEVDTGVEEGRDAGHEVGHRLQHGPGDLALGIGRGHRPQIAATVAVLADAFAGQQ